MKMARKIPLQVVLRSFHPFNLPLNAYSRNFIWISRGFFGTGKKKINPPQGGGVDKQQKRRSDTIRQDMRHISSLYALKMARQYPA